MTRTNDLARLSNLAGLVRDIRLADLRRATDKTAQLRAQLARLDATRAQVEGAETLGSAPAYLRWYRQARANLNTQLAAALAQEASSVVAARTAFGRAEVLEKLQRQNDGARPQAS
jgi:hypothetical protein